MSLNAINDRGLADALQRRLFIRDDVSISLMPELAATLNIDSQPELQYPLGWRGWTVGAFAPALAASATRFQIQNPPTSNVIALLEEITVASAGGDAIMIGFMGIANNARLATQINTAAILDGRMKGTSGATASSVCTVDYSTVNPAPFTQIGINSRIYQLLTNISFTVPNLVQRPYVLVPGSSLLCTFLSVNVQQGFQLQWRERMLNDQENSA